MDDYFLKSPCQQKFYYILALMLHIMGLGKRTWWGYKPMHSILHFHGQLTIKVAPFLPLSQFLYLYLNYKKLTFDVIGIVFSILPVSLMVNVNLISAKMDTYKSLLKIFMTKIHISNYLTSPNDFMRQRLLLVERITRITAYYLIFFFGLNWVFWIIIPVFLNISNREKIINGTMQLQTCVYMWMPFDYGYNYRNWTIVHIINVYIVGGGVTIMATLHCLNYIFIYHLIGHIQILKDNIKSGFVDDLSDEEVNRKLIGIIKYHAFIIRVFEDVQTAFGVNVAANYLHNLFSDSLILYQVLNGGDILSYAVMVGAYMGELIIMSFVIEEIRKQSEDLPDVVYSIPWENMTISNQKIVLLLLSRVQSDMQFIALGGLKAGVRPMVSILKATFSYYVMLKTSIESKLSVY